jgi:phosphonopyruvate decarboxylase
MIAASDFLRPAVARGLRFYSGVPCSFLSPLINGVIGDTALEYLGAANEGEAAAVAAGAWLAGRPGVVMCQNSGLGNMVNPLTSLHHSFRIPTLLVVTWRGQPGLEDEPQHELMGQITHRMLDVMQVGHRAFPREAADVPAALDEALGAMERTSLPFALILEKGVVRDEGLSEPPLPVRPPGQKEDLREHGPRPTRAAVLTRFLELAPETAATIATTGKCGRELFTLGDRRQHLYQVGSMGCASAMGLGVARGVRRPVVVLDGDGAALMRMGALATIGAYAPDNLVHVVLDNGVHDSTGGQATVSAQVRFADVARACSYPWVAECDSLAGFAEAFRRALATPGPRFIHTQVAPGSLAKLGRPTLRPPEVARRFKDFLAEPG